MLFLGLLERMSWSFGRYSSSAMSRSSFPSYEEGQTLCVCVLCFVGGGSLCWRLGGWLVWGGFEGGSQSLILMRAWLSPGP